MATQRKKTITVAAVQMTCKDRDVSTFDCKILIVCRRCTTYKEQRNLLPMRKQQYVLFLLFFHLISNQNAQLVLFPEMAFCGYILNSEAWNYAEPFNG